LEKILKIIVDNQHVSYFSIASFLLHSRLKITNPHHLPTMKKTPTLNPTSLAVVS